MQRTALICKRHARATAKTLHSFMFRPTKKSKGQGKI